MQLALATQGPLHVLDHDSCGLLLRALDCCLTGDLCEGRLLFNHGNTVTLRSPNLPGLNPRKRSRGSGEC